MVTLAADINDFWASLPQPEVLSRMADEPDPDVDWLWEGFLARGSVTLLTSQWKTGKTTLLSVLLSKLYTGGELAGRPVKPSRVVVFSEEDRMHWRMRSRRLDFGPHTLAYCRPFKTNPSMAQWQAMVDELVRRREQEGLDLVVFDTLSMLLPVGTENQFEIFNILRPLEELMSRGVAILLMHHPRKGQNLPGQAARGTGALTAYADIVVEMAFHSKSDRSDRRRELASWSRHAATPTELIIELSEDERDYREIPPPDPEVDRVVELVSFLSSRLDSQVSRRMVLEMWHGGDPPSASALHTYLERAVAQGLLVRSGSGHRDDAFLYGPPGMTQVMSGMGRFNITDDAEIAPPVVAKEPETKAPEASEAKIAERVISEVVVDNLIDDESDTVLEVSQGVAESGEPAVAVEVDVSAPEPVVEIENAVDPSDEVHKPPPDPLPWESTVLVSDFANDVDVSDDRVPSADDPSFHRLE